MNNYIHKIIDFFFHHEVSDEITERVYNRMVFPVEDKAREEAVSQIWDKLDDASCSDEKIEKAFYNLETSLGLKKEEPLYYFSSLNKKGRDELVDILFEDLNEI